MQFQITIEFDFTDDIGDGDTMDDFLTDEYKQSLIDETIEGVWEADDEEDLMMRLVVHQVGALNLSTIVTFSNENNDSNLFHLSYN